MKEKIVKNLSYIFCAGLGLFAVILLAFPYLKIKMREGVFTSIGGVVSGYSILAMFDYGYAGIVSAILQILVLLVSVLMLVYGIIGLIKSFIKNEQTPAKIGNVKSKTITEIALLVYSALNALLLIFLVILCINDSQLLDKLVSTYLFYIFNYIKVIPTLSVFLAMFIPIALYFTLRIFVKEEVEEIEEEEVENEEGLTLDDIIPTAQNMRK